MVAGLEKAPLADDAPAAKRLEKVSLEQLFAEAEALGHVRVFSSMDADPGTSYRAVIQFSMPQGVLLEAGSEFRMPLAAALMQAIERAQNLRKSVK